MTTTLMTDHDIQIIKDLITEKMGQDVECHLGMRWDADNKITHDVSRFPEDSDDVETWHMDDLCWGVRQDLDLTLSTGLVLDVYVYDAKQGFAMDVVNPEYNGTNWIL